jgi:hypothetical protein
VVGFAGRTLVPNHVGVKRLEKEKRPPMAASGKSQFFGVHSVNKPLRSYSCWPRLWLLVSSGRRGGGFVQYSVMNREERKLQTV